MMALLWDFRGGGGAGEHNKKGAHLESVLLALPEEDCERGVDVVPGRFERPLRVGDGKAHLQEARKAPIH